MNSIAPSAQPLDLFWFLPTGGDGRYLGSTVGQRTIDHRYLRAIAGAADSLGYGGVLIPTGRGCEDAWTVGASLLSQTERLRFLVAVRPGMTLPAEAARQAATFDRMSEGRLLVNVVSGGTPVDLAGDGLRLGHDERYAQTTEFLQIFRGLLSGETVDFEGKYLFAKGGKLLFPPVQRPYPPLYIGGSSAPGHELAATQCDVYLTWGEPPAQVAEKIADVRRRAAAVGRTVRFGIRLHLIVRETEDAAWAAADDLIQHLSDDVIAQAQRKLQAESDSEGQRRMVALHGGQRDRLVVSPNLWAGVGLVRGGAGTALVGDPATVAERIREYQALGIDTVIASGYPHLEECYRVAELLFPQLALQAQGGGERARLRGGPAYLAGGGSLSTDGFAAPAAASPAPLTRAF